MLNTGIEDNTYPFTWLDEVVEFTLNPEVNNARLIEPAQLETIRKKLPVEINRVMACLKTQTFRIYILDQVKVIAGHYYQNVCYLHKKASQNQQRYPKSGQLNKTGLLLLKALESLRQGITDRYKNFLIDPEEPVASAQAAKLQSKVLCAWSADQIGIFLRAAIDAKLILNSSMRSICQVVTPYLSTTWKKELSWDTVRSNAGRPELRDREITIEFLERLTDKIRNYR